MSSIKKNYIYNVIYQFLNYCNALLVTPYITRVLGTTNNGIYSYNHSVAYYFVLFAMLGVSNYGNRSIAMAKDDRKELDKTFSEIYTFQFLTSTLMLLAYFFYFILIVKEDRLNVMIQLLYVASALFDVNWFFFGMEKFKLTVTRNSIIKLATMAGIFLFVKDADDLWIYTIIMSAGYLISAVALWPQLHRYVTYRKPKSKDIVKHIKPNLVLFIPVIAISVYNTMDKIMLGKFTDKAQVAFYDKSEEVMQIPNTFINALTMVMLPRMTSLIKHNEVEKGQQYITNSMRFAIMMSCATSFGLAAVANDFAPLFFGKEFLPCATLIVWLAPIGIIKAWANVIRTQHLIPNCKDRIYVVSVVVGAVVNFVMNLLLIPHLGGVGAVIGTIAAEACVMLYQTLEVRHELPILAYIRQNIAFPVIGMIMFITVRFLEAIWPQTVLSLIAQIGIGIVVYIILSLGYMLAIRDTMLKAVLFKINNKKKHI